MGNRGRPILGLGLQSHLCCRDLGRHELCSEAIFGNLGFTRSCHSSVKYALSCWLWPAIFSILAIFMNCQMFHTALCVIIDYMHANTGAVLLRVPLARSCIGCLMGYCLDTYKHMSRKEINSQVNKQVNAGLFISLFQ